MGLPHSIRHQTKPPALQETCHFSAVVVHSFNLMEVSSFSYERQNKILSAQLL